MEEQKVDRELEIIKAIDELGKTVNETMEQVKILEERLNKIMKSSCPSTEDSEKKDKSNSCEIAEAIHDSREGIQFIYFKIIDLLERMEL